MLKTLHLVLFLSIGVGVAVGACSDDDGASTETTTTGTGATGGNGPTGGMGGGISNTTTGTNTTSTGMSTGSVPPPPTVEVECQGQVYDCGDLEDNDMDGLIDYQDPDCLGACDNTEGSLYGGIPGQMGPPCQVDCYWDQDSGTGNDGCFWDHRCDIHEMSPNYYPEPQYGAQCEYQGPDYVVAMGTTCAEFQAAQSDTCGSICGPLTPNGCDCFGCCELPAGSGQFIWLGSTGASGDTVCTWDKINDPTFCHPCVKVDSCFNDCDPCEICIGKPTLPPECGEGGGGGGSAPECPDGAAPCGLPELPPCGAGYYCITGCCIPEVQ